MKTLEDFSVDNRAINCFTKYLIGCDCSPTFQCQQSGMSKTKTT